MDKRQRYRAILGLQEGFTPARLKQAYRDLAKVWHPDRFADDERLGKKAARQLARINEAYAYLKDNPRPSTSANVATSQPDEKAEAPSGANNDKRSRTESATQPRADTQPPARGDVIEGITPLALRALRADKDAKAGGISAVIGLCLLAAAVPLGLMLHYAEVDPERADLHELAFAITGGVVALGVVILFVSGYVRLRAKAWVLRDLHEHDIPCPQCGVGIVGGVDAHNDAMTHIRHIQLRLLATVDSGRCMVCGQPWA